MKILILLLLVVSCQHKPGHKGPNIKLLCRHQKEYNIQTFKEIYRSQHLKNRNFGYILYDPQKNKIIEQHNADRAFIPASTHKIPTTLAALTILGPNYRFLTTLSYRGRIRKGILKGNIYLKGTGDPLLGSADIMNMAIALKKKGIKKVVGKFIYDDSYHRAQPQLDQYQEDHYAYNPGISALSSEFNRIYMHWQTENDITEYYFRPALAINYAEIPSEDEIMEANHILYNEEENTWILPQTAKVKGVVKLPVKDPSLYTASLLKKFAEFNGISLPPAENGVAPKHRRKIYVHKGMSVLDISRSVLEYSNNVMTELLMLATAKKLRWKKHDIKSAIRELKKWYSKQLPATNWQKYSAENGSGLSSKTRVTPRQMLAFLELANTKKFQKKEFMSLLPTSGWTGTLRSRMYPPEVAFRIWAKTGSMHFASTIAGHLYTKSNRKLLFALFVNDLKKRRTLDKTHDPDKKQSRIHRARYWNRRAKKAQDELLKRWVGLY